jgi:hypothetical protein
MDVNVRSAVTIGLRMRGVDVLTSQEDGTRTLSDSDLLDRAADLERLLFTHDDDLLREAAMRHRSGRAFGGVVYSHQLNATVRECIDDLDLIAKATSFEEWSDRIEFLPLK